MILGIQDLLPRGVQARERTDTGETEFVDLDGNLIFRIGTVSPTDTGGELQGIDRTVDLDWRKQLTEGSS